MSACYPFTFAAPVVTEEQEREEREALTEDERRKVHEDVYGGEQLVTETDTMLLNGVAMLRDAVLSIPDAEKTAYLEALEIAPLLVERESKPVAFLRCANYDVWAAARLLVAYWDMRKKIFGAERAFLPMTQSGAMADDMEYLEKALIMELPDDDSDRSVLFFDRIRCISSIAPRDSVVRCFFYMIHVICQRKNTQRRGFVVLINLRGLDLYKHFDRMMAKKVVQMISYVPAKLKGFHMITGSGKSVVELMLPLTKQMAGKEIRLRFRLHAGSEKEIYDSLGDFGLCEEHGQVVYRGSLRNIALHQEWIGGRLAIERDTNGRVG